MPVVANLFDEEVKIKTKIISNLFEDTPKGNVIPDLFDEEKPIDTANWQDIIKSDDYKFLPLGEKLKTKKEFFKYTISQKKDFKSLPIKEQLKIKSQFFNPKKEEMLDPSLPTKPNLGDILRYTKEEMMTHSPFPLLDKPIEELANFIEPDTAEEGVIGAIKFIPRQMLAEVVRAYKPTTVAAFGLAAKAIKPIASPVGKFIWKRTPEGLKRILLTELTVGKGQPQAYQQMAKEALLEKQAGAREAEQVAKVLTTKSTGETLTGEEQRYVGRIFRREVIESPALKAHPRYQELKAISDEGRAVMDKWSSELAQSGIPKEQTQKVIEENIGQYMARMYTTKLQPKETGLGFFKQLRLRLGMFKHRKDLSSEVLRQMGEIKEPALPTAIRVKQISANIANNKLFNQVAQNPEWTSNTAIQGWTKMPDTPNIGALKNKWVIPEIAEDINAIAKVGEQAQGIYLKALSAWKYGKVVLNPATQVRNMLSNTILLDLSGTNHLRQLQLFPKAFGEYLSKGKIYQQATEDGAIGGEFVGTETMQRLKDFYIKSQKNNIERWVDIAKMPFQKAGELYQGIEQLAKLVKYIDVLEKGGTRKLAAGEAQKWLFNYNEIPKFIDFLRKSPMGAPFATFSYKAIPRLAETLVNNPLRLYKYYALANAWNETARKTQGMLPTEFVRAKKALPDWLLKDIGGMPTNLLMPYKDKYKRTQWLNLEYILPVGMAPEIMEKGIIRGGIGNPLFNILADLQKNSDFRGKPIIPPEATQPEATQAVISHIYRQLVPSLAPGIPSIAKGGYSFEKIMDSILKRPDFVERTRDLTPVLLDTLMGLKINALDIDEAESFKMMDKKKRIDVLHSQFYKLQHPAISEKERDKQTEIIFKKIQGIIDER